MQNRGKLGGVSEAPTHPTSRANTAAFDVADLYRGPVDEGRPRPEAALPLDEKLRQAYFWITNHAITRSSVETTIERRSTTCLAKSTR
jgi:hypothetical protein